MKALNFRRSTYCHTGSCVEVAPMTDGRIAVRDSKNPAIEPMAFSRDEWIAFVRGVQDNQFNFDMPVQ